MAAHSRPHGIVRRRSVAALAIGRLACGGWNIAKWAGIGSPVVRAMDRPEGETGAIHGSPAQATFAAAAARVGRNSSSANAIESVENADVAMTYSLPTMAAIRFSA